MANVSMSPVKKAAARAKRDETRLKNLTRAAGAPEMPELVGEAREFLQASAANDEAATRTLDSFNNYILQLGVDTDNALSASTYGFNPITRVRTLLEWIHRGSWLGGVAIDLVAEDMVKMGIQFTGELPPDDIQALQRGLVDLGIWEAICDTLKWGRLYGGALGTILIDGQNLNSPLRIDTVGKGQFKGLLALDRWMVEPDLVNLVNDYGPALGMPEFYRVTSDAPALNLKVIHYSRCLRVEGIRLPYWQRVMENLWGISVLERLYDRMVAFDAATQGAAQLVHKMFIRIYKVKGLREIASSNTKALSGLMAYLQIMRRAQSNEGITMIDSEDDYVPHQQTVNTGISDTLARLGEQICGALQMPGVRLFGTSPGGLNSSGDFELRMYYDGIRLQQNQKLKIPLTTIIRVLAKSLGIVLPKVWDFDFVPLWQMTEEQKASIAASDTASVVQAEERKLVSQQTAMRELKQSSIITGRFSNITEDDIEAADDSVEPPQAEELMMGAGGAGEAPEGARPGREGAPAPQADRGPSGSRVRAGSVRDAEWVWRAARGVRGLPISEFQGVPIVIECPKGEVRWPGGPQWPADYGYIRYTVSAEGPDEGVDCFIGNDRESTRAFIVNHFTEDGRFEEHKVFLGYGDFGGVLRHYRESYGRPVQRPADGPRYVEVPAAQLMAYLRAVDPVLPLEPLDNPRLGPDELKTVHA